MMKREAISKISNFILTEIEWLVEGAAISFSRGSLNQKILRMDKAYAQWEINKALRYAENRGFLVEKNKRYVLSKKGRKWVNRQKFNQLCFKPSKKWDRSWRIIIFDVPEEERTARDLLRGKLFDWQCTKLQQSVFITPHNCERELGELAKALSAETYMHVIVSKQLDPVLENKLLKIYQLT
ncbi:MAG TPA: hypothetical protein VI953_02620 [Candidatus Paceibacterota bacterium]